MSESPDASPADTPPRSAYWWNEFRYDRMLRRILDEVLASSEIDSELTEAGGITREQVRTTVERNAQELSADFPQALASLERAASQLDALIEDASARLFPDPMDRMELANILTRRVQEELRRRASDSQTPATARPSTKHDRRFDVIFIFASLIIALAASLFAINQTGLTRAGFFAVGALSTLSFLVHIKRLLYGRQRRRKADDAARQTAEEASRREAELLKSHASYLEALASPEFLEAERAFEAAATEVRYKLETAALQAVRSAINYFRRERALAAERSARERDAILWAEAVIVREWSGLDEPPGTNQWIDVPALTVLQRVLKSKAGSSIGVAGPRGAGKTTLLRRVVEEPDLTPWVTVRVITSAPVDFSARDFVLHLFSLVCRAVGGEDSAPSATPPLVTRDGAQKVVRWVQARQVTLTLLAICSVTYEAVPSVIAAGNEFALRAFVGLTTAAAARILTLTARRRVLQRGNGFRHAPNAQEGAVARRVAIGRQLTETHRIYGPVFLFGLILALVSYAPDGWRWPLTLALAATIYIGLSRSLKGFLGTLRRVFGIPLVSAGSLSFGGQAFPDHLPGQEPLATRATAKLQSIRFQLGFSSGWGGSFNVGGVLPGITLGQSQSLQETWTGNQRTLPEIVTEFRAFLTEVVLSTGGAIVIAIDEVDKIADPNAARRFVNDVKALFGVPGTHFLMSVSEEALGNFERRGIDIRSDFDSAFEQIVRVEPLDFGRTLAVVEKRVIGLSMPFVLLLHALSSGLPRDVLRLLRELRDSTPADEQLSLLGAVTHLVAALIKSTARGALISFEAGSGSPEVITLCVELAALPDVTPDALSRVLRQSPSAGVRQQEADNVARQLRLRLLAVVYLGLTVLEFFALNTSWSERWRGTSPPVVPAHFELLPQGLRLIATDPLVAWSDISQFRTVAGLASVNSPAVVVTPADGRGEANAS